MRLKLTLIGIALVAGISFVSGSKLTRSSVTPTRPTVTGEQELTADKAVSTQRHMNRYFHNDVIPKLKDCWARIQGKGTVELQHTYLKHPNGRWIVDRLALSSSTLPAGQDAVALKCMQAAVKDTSLPVESTDSTQARFTAFWSWPVPLPADFPKQASALMAAPTGATGGCDGKGSLPRCWACGRGGCKRACVGGEACRTTIRSCVLIGDCATGGPTYVGGGAVIQ
jgi:hypothetical protein